MDDVNVTNVLVNVVKNLINNPQDALEFVQNPQGKLVEEGISEQDLSGVDMQSVVEQACADPSVSPEARTALQSNPPAPPANSGPPTFDHVATQLTHVVAVTHEHNQTITNIIDKSNNVDNSTDIEVGDDFDGDIDIDNDNVTAQGPGAVAGGEDVNAATGAQSQVIDGDVNGQNQNASPGAVQAGDDIDGVVNTGRNDGVIADGDVDRTIVGNNNEQQANDLDIEGDVDGVIKFGDGDGDINNVNDSTLDDVNVGSGTNVSDNDLDDGSAIGTGSGDVSGRNEDVDITKNEIDAEDSIVNTEQGAGDQENDSLNAEVEVELPGPEESLVRATVEPETNPADEPIDAPA